MKKFLISMMFNTSVVMAAVNNENKAIENQNKSNQNELFFGKDTSERVQDDNNNNISRDNNKTYLDRGEEMYSFWTKKIFGER